MKTRIQYVKLAQAPTASWQEVLAETNRKPDLGVVRKAAQATVDGFYGLKKSFGDIKNMNLSPDSLKRMLSFAKSVFSKKADEEIELILKLAEIPHSDQMAGGLADEKKPENFDPIQLEKGISVELEHTDDQTLALEIAMDHLSECPDYYSRLEILEKTCGEKITFSKEAQETTLLGKAVPFFSLFMALRNMYLGNEEFKKINQDAESIGISSKQVLDPNSLMAITKKNSNNPGVLKIITQAARKAQEYHSQITSAKANTIDAIKDGIMFLVGISTFGLGFILDVGLSFAILFAYELPETSAITSQYDQVISHIRQTAEAHLQPDEPQEAEPQFKSWEEMTEDEQEEYWEQLLS